MSEDQAIVAEDEPVRDSVDCSASCPICNSDCTKVAVHSGQHWCSTHQGY